MTWGPAPGYESTDLGFNRPILAGCIFCHSGRFKRCLLRTKPDEPSYCYIFRRTLSRYYVSANHNGIARSDSPRSSSRQKKSSPSLFTLLQAYGELAAYRAEYMAPYLKVLDQLSRTEPNNALVQAALGNRNLQNEKFQEAADHLRRALKIGPSQATYYGELAAALQKLGRTEEALSIQKEAVQKDPYNPILQKRWCFF